MLIFEKALDEPKYSSMYAQLCRRLCEEAPSFEPTGSGVPCWFQTFRRLLLKKCQDEFENRSKATEAYDKKDGPLTTDEEEQRSVVKHKMLGNIKFIGELGKLDMLHETILHKCIKQLLEKKKRHGGLRDMAEDLECLCQIMRTTGRNLDTDKAKSLMNQYFDRMKQLAGNQELPSRIRFMLQDVLELRDHKWVPRKVLSDHGPKTIAQVREEAAKDFGYYIPSSNSHMQGNRSGQGMGSAMIFGRGPKSRGGLDDVFGSMPLGAANLGTGPGVISTDNFNGYSNNMGRQGRASLGNANSFLLSNQPSQQFLYPNRQNSQTQNQFQSSQNSQSQFSSGKDAGSKDVPPRFMKKSPFTNPDEISLRPAQNSMMQLKKVPSSVSKSSNSPTQGTGGTDNSLSNQTLSLNHRLTSMTNPLMPKETPILIKQGTLDKNKANKKEGPTKAEVLKKLDLVLETLRKNQNVEEAMSTLRESKIPKKFNTELVVCIVNTALDKTDAERELMSKLLTAMKKDSIIISHNFLEGFKGILQQISEREVEVPRVKSHVAGFAARAVVDEIATLTEIADPLEGGSHYPLFLLCLQQLHKLQGKQWLGNVFNESRITLPNMLPEIDRSKERLIEILEDRGLSFLFPLLRIQTDLTKQIQNDANPALFYKWIKENVDCSLHTVPGFINALVTCLVRHVTQDSTLVEGTDPSIAPDKGVQEKEKELLEKYKPVFQAFLHDHIDLQVIALYTLQVHCHNNNFPKGMLLRWFVMFYDMEIIEEEAFLKWKEDLSSDDYPGKGKALFQVNQWLTWLEEAEEEEEGSDEGDN